MLQRQSTVSSHDNGNPLPLYANATSQVSEEEEEEEEEGLVRIQNASASYQSLNFDDGFSYVLQQLDNEDYQTRANLVAQYEVISKGTPPIGLQLRKSPSLLELLEDRLDPPPRTMADKPEKLKAAHFPISLLQIGNFTKVATHEADLVAKCYYAKQKLVWETLDNGLKNKMEIQWQDILSMRAVVEQSKPGILLIELKQPPTFCHEADPKPRKHTIWKPSHDFTGNQASTYRRHILEFPPGVLDKHYEKLIQCDGRLLELSRGPCPRLANPYFPCILYNEHMNFSNGDDVGGPNSKTNWPSASEVAVSSQGINDFARTDSMSSANTAQVELQRAGFENLSNMADMILTDSDKDRHVAKVKSLYSFAGPSMEVDPTLNINACIQAESWDALNRSNRSLEQFPAAASNASADLHIYRQLFDEGRLNHTQPLLHIPPLQVSHGDGNMNAPVPEIWNPLVIPKWSGQHDYHDYYG